MRQAGRHLSEYRRIREKYGIMTICETPELCAEVSSLPVDVLGVDAAIMFADIMLPLEGMGVAFEIKEGLGPMIPNPTRDLKSVMSLQDFHPSADVPFILDAISLTKKRLDWSGTSDWFCWRTFHYSQLPNRRPFDERFC